MSSLCVLTTRVTCDVFAQRNTPWR